MRARYLDYISKWKQGLVEGNWGEVSDYISLNLITVSVLYVDGEKSIHIQEKYL